MKTIFNLLARLVACVILSAVCVLTFMFTVILAEEGSAWYLLTAAACFASFICAIRVFISDHDRDDSDFDPKREDPRAAACKDADAVLPSDRVALITAADYDFSTDRRFA